METLAKQIKETVVTPTAYQQIAKDCKTSVRYVGQIARGERNPIRGKGLKVLNKLKKLTSK